MKTGSRPKTGSLPARLLILTFSFAPAVSVHADGRVSQTITSVLREPLPPEDLTCHVRSGDIVIEGPTFRYTVDRASGGLRDLEVKREGHIVASLQEPADIVLDAYRLTASGHSGKAVVASQSKQVVVLNTEGVMSDPVGQGPSIRYTLVSTFYNDGVVVSEITLRPTGDLPVEKAISHRLLLEGRFTHYLHKDHRHYDSDRPGSHPRLPAVGKSATFTSTTSCLQVSSHEAAVAMFTDFGASHVSPAESETASLEVLRASDAGTRVALTQHIARVGSEGEPYLLKAKSGFRFRFGISVSPNRQPHRRWRDLRHYVWIADEKNPYPTDREIEEAAQLGYTLFQMHRVGLPGQPRPPAGEIERVINKVHEMGMLFIWLELPDLIFVQSERVRQMRADGTWPLWGASKKVGGYRASMDSYCTLIGTCIAAPNGLGEYRLSLLGKMMDKYGVDGVYLDDNYSLDRCEHWKEHGHPRKNYDCLIELHEMNWRRRQLLREKCPHMVLIDHCGRGLALPVICDFDVHLFGEGRDFNTLEDYWDFWNSFKHMSGQGNMWPGDVEGTRCAVEVAYNYDLLTGGGQYMYTDWRLYPKKFPYAAGVRDFEPLFVKAYNLAQFYFGMYESRPYYFATSRDMFSTTTPGTYVTVYRNTTWGDYLIPVANMNGGNCETSLVFHSLGSLGIDRCGDYVLYDVNERANSIVKGQALTEGIRDIQVSGRSLKLLYLRRLPDEAPYHLWGGKRISETWDRETGKLTLRLHGPAGLDDSVFIGGANKGIREVRVDGKAAAFFFDSARAVAHGNVTFGRHPITVETVLSENGRPDLPKKAVTPNELTTKYLRQRWETLEKERLVIGSKPSEIATDSTYQGYTHAPINDGRATSLEAAKMAGRLLGNGDNSWASHASEQQHWITLSWETPRQFDRVVVWWAIKDMWPRRYKIQYWNEADGGFVDVSSTPEWQTGESLMCAHRFVPVRSTKLRVLQDAHGGGPGRRDIMFVQEVQAYEKAN